MANTLAPSPPLLQAQPGFDAVTVVIDTNVLLDLWVFANPGVLALLEALNRGELRWLATAAMRSELEHTLAKPSLTAWRPDPHKVLGQFDRLSTCAPAPATTGVPRLSCRDPKDQMFIDLALAHRAPWLISHDRALLALARQAKIFGVAVVRPAQWQAPTSTPD